MPRQMNVHHLELFYYVARHSGISAAVRHMPYGIQQPAVSSQILQLEETLGVKLFERQPFKLTEEGDELLAFARPFFDNVDAMAEKLSRRTAQVRIGGSEALLRDHLPAVMKRVQADHPGLRLVMRAGFQPELETQLRNRELDLAFVTALQPRVAAGLRRVVLLRMPLVLMVHRKSSIKSAAELWSRQRIDEPLISSVPAPDGIFQKGLKRMGVEWRPSIEATSLELVTWYVANGHGIGVNINLPSLVRRPQVRVLPLEGFDPVEIVGIWRGEPAPIIRAIIVEALRYARENFPDIAGNEAVNGEALK
jgi:DNA-binding transcriptional LysR family regulator